jgi:hypothetical protein
MDRKYIGCLWWILVLGVYMFILQWNAQQIRAHGDELKNAVYEWSEKPDLLCIQESWLTGKQKYRIPGYEIVRKDRDGSLGKKGGGGVLIGIRNGLVYKPLVLDVCIENMEIMAIKVFLSSTNAITVINLYNPCLSIDKNGFDNLLNYVSGRVIICGDFNAHNVLWGSKKNDKNGTVLENIIDEHQLVCLNNGDGTRLDRKTGKLSRLDLTLVSRDLASSCNWEVGGNRWDSDHFPILFV